MNDLIAQARLFLVLSFFCVSQSLSNLGTSHALIEASRHTGISVVNGRSPVLVDNQGRINQMMRNTILASVETLSGNRVYQGSGVAIGTRCILTAQHVSNQAPEPKRLRFYSYDGLLVAEESRDQRTNHPEADLALIRLDRKIAWSRGLGLGQIANREFTQDEIKNFSTKDSLGRAIVMGFGLSRVLHDPSSPSGIRLDHLSGSRLHEGFPKILGYKVTSHGEDPNRYLILVSDENNIMNQSFVSRGDSGGPVFYNGQLHGIISKVTNIEGRNFKVGAPIFSYAVAVAHYADWLRTNYHSLSCDPE